MTGGYDILYLITPRNLEIRLDIGLCCFEMCFGTGLLTGLQWYPGILLFDLQYLTYAYFICPIRSIKWIFYHRKGYQILD